MFRNAVRSLIVAAATLIAAGTAMAQDKFAFVVGIDSYRELTPLQKARGDAQAIANRLTGLGFKVDLHFDADRRTLNEALSSFTAKLPQGAIAYFHFSGHGVELDGESFLLPSDTPAPKTANREFIKTEAIRLHDVIDSMKRSGAGTRLLVVDACRDNPFATKFGRSLGATRGLVAPPGAPAGTFIMYSAGYGQAALDRLGPEDKEPTSVYTRVLVRELAQPGKSIVDIAQSVRAEVSRLANTVGHEQRPAYYDELTAPLVLVGAGLSIPPLPQVAALPAAPVTTPAALPPLPTLPQLPPGQRIELAPVTGGPAMIFGDSNRRFLNAAEVAALARRSPALVGVAKNEILARHGRKFAQADLDRYFKQYPWYRPLTDDDGAIVSRLNLFEKANLDLLRMHEKR